ncbi:MAG TPA: sugar-binding protein, partial [Planctomycetota bacterium]|nr:sugar-binding protein [Planctomycetota bacterium]
TPEEVKPVTPRHTCARASRAIVVDGDLSEWEGIAQIVLDQPGQAHGTWKDAADLSGSARLCYDSDYLYLAFVTTDDVFRHTYPLIPIWAGDCVQIAFDPLEDRRVGTRAPDDQEMTVALTPEGPRLARWAGPQGRGTIATAKLGLVRRKTGGGVIYEIAIPWDELAPLAPKLRPSFGFTFSLNDYDERPEEAWLQWTPGIQNGKNPSAFGQVVLEYTPPPAGETELHLTSTVPEKPNVTELSFPLFRHAVTDEKLAVEMKLAADNETVAERKTEIAVKPGGHALAVVWRPKGVPDGTYSGTVAVSDASGKTVTRTFDYERMITAPLAKRIDTLDERIATLAKRRVELYARHEATLAYRMDIAKHWIAGGSTVRNWRTLPKLLDETEAALAAMLKGTDGFADARGTILLAYRAPEDDMPQPYRVEVPADYDASKPYPLVVNIHGYGGAGLTYDLWCGITMRSADAEREARPGYLVAVPYGRGNTGWRGWGRGDVFHVIDAMKRDYKIDPDRIYITGFSMGGYGTWYLSTRYPHLWAACGPYAGGLGRYDALKPEEADDWQKQLSAAGSEMLVLKNLKCLPTGIYHGIADATVSVRHSEEAFKRLREMEYNAVLTAPVRAGHDMSQGLRDGLTDWMLEYTRDAAPKEVVYAAWDLRHNRAYWVEIDELTVDYHPADVRAKFVEPGKIDLTATNTNRLTLTLPEKLMGDATSLVVTANGFEVKLAELPESRQVHLRTADGGTTWTVSDARCREGLIKRHGMSGPIDEAFADRFILVVGTAGDDAADKTNRTDAGTFAERLKGLTWGRMWGDFPIKDDVDVTPEDIRTSNLILFGGPDGNVYTRKIAGRLPAKVVGGKLVFRGKTYDDSTTAVRFIYPNPENASRYVVATYAATRAALENVDRFARPTPDWLLFDAESAGRRAENKRPTFAEGGFFDRDWK